MRLRAAPPASVQKDGEVMDIAHDYLLTTDLIEDE